MDTRNYTLTTLEQTSLKEGDWVTWGSRSSAHRVLHVGTGGVLVGDTVVTLGEEDARLREGVRLMVTYARDEVRKVTFNAVPENLTEGTPFVEYRGNASKIAQPKATAKIASTGGSTDYYLLPAGAEDLNDLIEHKAMDFATGNIFKAAYRLDDKEGVEPVYDLRKIIWFATRKLLKALGLRLSDMTDEQIVETLGLRRKRT